MAKLCFFVTMEQDGLQGLFQSLATSPLRNSDCPTNYEDVDTDVVGTSRDWANRLQTTGLHTNICNFRVSPYISLLALIRLRHA